MTGQRVGYKRVSSVDQNTMRQLEGVAVDRVFEDKASGKDTNRPQLQTALEYCRSGDTLVVHSMDRLARNLGDLLNLVKGLTDRGVHVEFLHPRPMTFTGGDSPLDQMLLAVLGAVAQFERAMILERQREGIQLAKAEGKYRGGQFKLSDDRAAELRNRAAQGENKAALAREFNISRQTLYTYLGESGEPRTDTRKRVTSTNPSTSGRKNAIRIYHGGTLAPTQSRRPVKASRAPANPSGKSQGRGKRIPR